MCLALAWGTVSGSLVSDRSRGEELKHDRSGLAAGRCGTTLRERKAMETITLDDARRVIAAAEQKAQEIDCPMDIAVVDAGGNLKAHVRMDDAFIGSITISINKAYTAIAFQGETKDLVNDTQPGGPIFGLSDAHGGNLVIFPGGIPLRRGGDIVGAIGVSTGTVEQDQEVAEAGAAAF
jgi:uncharacterized protein GlcG (DUF336 family)